jgi:V-type H+-transporting ATPase subunit e
MSIGVFIGTIFFIGIGIGVCGWLKGVVTRATKNLSDLHDNLL